AASTFPVLQRRAHHERSGGRSGRRRVAGLADSFPGGGAAAGKPGQRTAQLPRSSHRALSSRYTASGNMEKLLSRESLDTAGTIGGRQKNRRKIKAFLSIADHSMAGNLARGT